MKKIFIGTLLFLGATFVQAQTFTPKAGLTLSNVTTDDISFFGIDLDFKSKVGFSIGAAYAFEIDENFSIQPELSFIQKGFTMELNFVEEDFDETIKSNIEAKISTYYIELPVLAKYTFGTGSTKFFINAGPSIGLGIGGKYKTKASVTATDSQGNVTRESESADGKVKFGGSNEENEDSDDLYINNSLDFGIQIGGGMVIADKIQVDLRYGVGLTNLFDEQESDPDAGLSLTSNDSKNRVWQLTVGIPLRFK